MKEKIDGVELIANERIAQKYVHRYTVDHDLSYDKDELISAAGYYLTNGDIRWPWKDFPQLKNKSDIEKLVIAGALIAAEIDRLLTLQRDK